MATTINTNNLILAKSSTGTVAYVPKIVPNFYTIPVVNNTIIAPIKQIPGIYPGPYNPFGVAPTTNSGNYYQ